MNIFESRRHEPRVVLKTRAVVIGDAGNGRTLRQEAVTIDVSPHGASVVVADELAIGTYVRYEAIGYFFRTRARVCSCTRDDANGLVILGLEHPDRANPLVIWGAADREPAPPESKPLDHEMAYVLVRAVKQPAKPRRRRARNPDVH